MTAAVPQIIVDMGIAAGVFTAIATATAVMWKTPPVRWFRKHISESLGAWMRERVAEAQAEHIEYVRFHLGPNGTTKPIHRRLQDVEHAVRRDHPEIATVDWNGPYDEDGA